VRSDRAIRRHWQLVCCAFAFCWWAAAQRGEATIARDEGEEEMECVISATEPVAGRGNMGERQRGVRPLVSWPTALRQVRGWLAPWTLLRRWWQTWSDLPPPSTVQRLLDHLGEGHPQDC
jgi:hypothetical protein